MDRIYPKATTVMAGAGASTPAWLADAHTWASFALVCVSLTWISWQLFWAIRKKICEWKERAAK
jgi:hypothetical protein